MLEVRSVHVAIDSVVALRGLSLEVGSGRIIADDTPRAALATDDVRRYVTGEILQE